VMGSMIGSGVFIVAADVSRQVASPGLFFLTWVISGVMTVLAALCYGELAGMMMPSPATHEVKFWRRLGFTALTVGLILIGLIVYSMIFAYR